MTTQKSGGPNAKTAQWGDLIPRVGSAIVMVIIGVAAVWFGGVWFRGLVIIIVGLMIWELVRMVAPERSGSALQAGVLGSGALAALLVLPGVFFAPVVLAAAIVISGLGQARKNWVIGFSVGIILAGLSLIHILSIAGLSWVLWLLAIVVATDIAGYFAGRIFGGPKFWPKFSPKKTWSGTIAGWICAAVISFWFVNAFELPIYLVFGGVLMSFASQMGDIAESALKRTTGVKDSSNLIPGHGGVMDRFDGMLAAALLGGVLLVVQAAV